MAEAAVQPRLAHPSRLRALILPREHGAWGILLVPLFTGAGVGLLTQSRWLPLTLFAVAALALFWMRTPVESWLGASPLRAQTSAERNAVLLAALGLGSVAGTSLAALQWGGQNRALLVLGGIAGLAFVAQAVLRKLGRRTRMLAQVVGAVGLTCTAPGAYYVITGQLDSRALALWLANWLFAGNQIHFVQLRLHAARARGWREKLARGRTFFAGQVLMVLALALAWRWGSFPALALAAFVPVLLRGTLWLWQPPHPLEVHRLGWSELRHALAFGVLLVAAFVVA
jgi:hypothetical protein